MSTNESKGWSSDQKCSKDRNRGRKQPKSPTKKSGTKKDHTDGSRNPSKLNTINETHKKSSDKYGSPNPVVGKSKTGTKDKTTLVSYSNRSSTHDPNQTNPSDKDHKSTSYHDKPTQRKSTPIKTRRSRHHRSTSSSSSSTSRSRSSATSSTSSSESYRHRKRSHKKSQKHKRSRKHKKSKKKKSRRSHRSRSRQPKHSRKSSSSTHDRTYPQRTARAQTSSSNLPSADINETLRLICSSLGAIEQRLASQIQPTFQASSHQSSIIQPQTPSSNITLNTANPTSTIKSTSTPLLPTPSKTFRKPSTVYNYPKTNPKPRKGKTKTSPNRPSLTKSTSSTEAPVTKKMLISEQPTHVNHPPNKCNGNSIFAGSRWIPTPLRLDGTFSPEVHPDSPAQYTIVSAGYGYGIGMIKGEQVHGDKPLFMTFGHKNATRLERFMIAQTVTLNKYVYVEEHGTILRSNEPMDWLDKIFLRLIPVANATSYTIDTKNKTGTHLAAALVVSSASQVVDDLVEVNCSVTTRRVIHALANNNRISPRFKKAIQPGTLVNIDYFIPIKNTHYEAFGMVLTEDQMLRFPENACTPVSSKDVYITCVEHPSLVTTGILNRLVNPTNTYSSVTEYARDSRTIIDMATAITGYERAAINLQAREVILTGKIQAFNDLHMTVFEMDTTTQDITQHSTNLGYTQPGETVEVYWENHEIHRICQAIVRELIVENNCIMSLTLQRVIYLVKETRPNREDNIIEINLEESDGVLEPNLNQVEPALAAETDEAWWKRNDYPLENIKITPASDSTSLYNRYKSQANTWKPPSNEPTRDNLINVLLHGIQPKELRNQVKEATKNDDRAQALATELPRIIETFKQAKLNKKQREVLDQIFCKDEEVLFINAPPGTGKTFILAEAAKALIYSNLSYSLILSAVTNEALDNIIRNLRNQEVPSQKVLHIQSTAALSKPQAINEYSVPNHVRRLLSNPTQYKISPHDLKLFKDYIYLMDVNPNMIILDMKIANLVYKYDLGIQVVAATVALVEKHSFLRKSTHWFIDEASLLLTTAFLAIKSKLKTYQMVIVGDPLQMSPHTKLVNDDHVLRYGFRSLATSIVNQGLVPSITLTESYRSNHFITSALSESFYHNTLTSALSDDPTRPESNLDVTHSDFPLPTKNYPVTLIHLDYPMEENEIKLIHNPKQQEAARELTQKLAKHFPTHTITVLCYYKTAVNALSTLATEFNNVKVSTVDAYQGRECDITVIVTSRTAAPTRASDFVTSAERTTVALSRAKKAMFIFGDFRYLSNNLKDNGFNLFINHVQSYAKLTNENWLKFVNRWKPGDLVSYTDEGTIVIEDDVNLALQDISIKSPSHQEMM